MSFITGLAATAMTIAVMAMFIVISIFSGLEELNKELVNNIHADLTIKSKEGKLLKNPEEIISVLEKEHAIKDYRTLIGNTNPETAEEGTIRKDFALSQRENSVHGSDSLESAKREIAYFFVDSEIYTY